MDLEEHLTEQDQPRFFTRAAARHLRRKRLNDARRALGQQAYSTYDVNINTGQETVAEKDTRHPELAHGITKSKARRLRKKNNTKLVPNCCNSCDSYIYAPTIGTGLEQDGVEREIEYRETVTKSKARRLRKKKKAKLIQNTCSFCYDVDTILFKYMKTPEYDSTCCIKPEFEIVNNRKQDYTLEHTICHMPFEKKTEESDPKFGNVELKEDLSDLSDLLCSPESSDLVALGDEVQVYCRKQDRNTNQLGSNIASRIKQKIEETIEGRINCTQEDTKSNRLVGNSFNEFENDLNDSQEPTKFVDFDGHGRNLGLDYCSIESKENVALYLDDDLNKADERRRSCPSEITAETEAYPSPNKEPLDFPSKMTDSKTNILEKTREEIKAEREAKKAAKAAAKAKGKTPKTQEKQDSSSTPKIDDAKTVKPNETLVTTNKENVKVASNTSTLNKTLTVVTPAEVKIDGKSKAELRAERRAKQEAQRMAKQQQQVSGEKNRPKLKEVEKPIGGDTNPVKIETTKKVVPKENAHEVNLFKHLYHERELAFIKVPSVNSNIHPAIIRLGVQYESKVIVGSNARCIALLAAVKQLVKEFERPSQADFIRGLEASLQESVAYLHYCRPLAVSMQNALRHLKWQMTQLPSTLSDMDAKSKLCSAIDTYILEQIQLAGKAISITIQTKISNGNVILTYGYSSLIHKILLDAHKAGKKFRVIVVDGRPWLEGKEQLRRLTKHGIECSYILINALSFVMPEVSKVFLGAHAILANGAVMSRVGTAQVALIARAFNVPVLVACGTHKSCERVQTDSIVYNELGNANELAETHEPGGKKSLLSNWKTKKSLNLLNIMYDVTPADLVTAVVTELAILPCTSVPVILRIKPSEI